MADKTANAQTQKKWTAWLTQTFYWTISLDRGESDVFSCLISAPVSDFN